MIKHKPKSKKSKLFSVSDKKLRILSGIIFALSCVAAFFSIKKEYDWRNTLSRIYVPNSAGPLYTYKIVWEIFALTIIFFITGLTLLIVSLRKKSIE